MNYLKDDETTTDSFQINETAKSLSRITFILPKIDRKQLYIIPLFESNNLTKELCFPKGHKEIVDEN